MSTLVFGVEIELDDRKSLVTQDTSIGLYNRTSSLGIDAAIGATGVLVDDASVFEVGQLVHISDSDGGEDAIVKNVVISLNNVTFTTGLSGDYETSKGAALYGNSVLRWVQNSVSGLTGWKEGIIIRGGIGPWRREAEMPGVALPGGCTVDISNTANIAKTLRDAGAYIQGRPFRVVSFSDTTKRQEWYGVVDTTAGSVRRYRINAIGVNALRRTNLTYETGDNPKVTIPVTIGTLQPGTNKAGTVLWDSLAKFVRQTNELTDFELGKTQSWTGTTDYLKTFDLYDGTRKSFMVVSPRTRLTFNVEIGETTIFVNETSAFNIGDFVSIGSGSTQEDFGYVVSIDTGVSLTMSAAALYDHAAGEFVFRYKPDPVIDESSAPTVYAIQLSEQDSLGHTYSTWYESDGTEKTTGVVDLTSHFDGYYVRCVRGAGIGQLRRITNAKVVIQDSPNVLQITVASLFKTQLKGDFYPTYSEEDGLNSQVMLSKVDMTYIADAWPCYGYIDDDGNFSAVPEVYGYSSSIKTTSSSAIEAAVEFYKVSGLTFSDIQAYDYNRISFDSTYYNPVSGGAKSYLVLPMQNAELISQEYIKQYADISAVTSDPADAPLNWAGVWTDTNSTNAIKMQNGWYRRRQNILDPNATNVRIIKAIATIVGTASAGQPDIVVDDASNFSVGDVLFFVTSRESISWLGASYPDMTIESISGNTITFTGNLTSEVSSPNCVYLNGDDSLISKTIDGDYKSYIGVIFQPYNDDNQRCFWATSYSPPPWPERCTYDKAYVGIRMEEYGQNTHSNLFQDVKIASMGTHGLANVIYTAEANGEAVRIDNLPDWYYTTNTPSTSNRNFYIDSSGDGFILETGSTPLWYLHTGLDNMEIETTLGTKEEYEAIESIGVFIAYRLASGDASPRDRAVKLYEMAMVFEKEVSVGDSIYASMTGRIRNDTWDSRKVDTDWFDTPGDILEHIARLECCSDTSPEPTAGWGLGVARNPQINVSRSLLTGDVIATATQIPVADGSLFRAGQTVTIKDNASRETRIVSSISGNTVTVSAALTNAYTTAAGAVLWAEGCFDADDFTGWSRLYNLGAQFQEYDDCWSDHLKETICRDTMMMSWINRFGQTCVRRVVKEEVTPTDSITLADITDRTKVEIKDPPPSSAYPQPTLRYMKNPANGDYQKTIDISHASASTYSNSYVSGIDSAYRAQQIWERCHDVYGYQKELTEPPSEWSDYTWLSTQGASAYASELTCDKVSWMYNPIVIFPAHYNKVGTWEEGHPFTIQLPHHTGNVVVEARVKSIEIDPNEPYECMVEAIMFRETIPVDYDIHDTMTTYGNDNDWIDTMTTYGNDQDKINNM